MAVLILLDFSKAFDRVSHELLKIKLNDYGFDIKLIAWISNFLKSRWQRVVLGGVYSDWAKVTSGVPQGSVIGPLLFLIYINDMPEIVKSFVSSLLRSKTIWISYQNDLDAFIDWSKLWEITFNIEKCKVIKFGEKPSKNLDNCYFTMKDDIGAVFNLETTKIERNLGVILTIN